MKFRLKDDYKYFFILMLGIILLNIIIHVQQNKFREKNVTIIEYEPCPQEVNRTDSSLMISRAWIDHYSRSYCMNYQVNHTAFEASSQFRNNYHDYTSSNYKEFWGGLYNSIYEEEKDKLDYIYKELDRIRTEKGINGSQFAEAIVAFVQDIDYVYVMSNKGCDDREHKSKECVEEVRFGLYSPVEFTYNLDGDCDTRSLLLYCTLKHFGFDTMIMISNAYRHALIVVNVISSGDHIQHKGKKFYFWETTAKGWLAGMLPPDYNVINNWEIALE